MGIELTPSELDDFLTHASTVILSIPRERQAALLVPLWFAWDEGAVYMNTALASKKVGYLRRHPEVSCLVESGDKYFTLKAVLMIGPCQVNENQEEVNIQVWTEWLTRVKPLYKELFSWSELPPHLHSFYAQPRATLKVTPRSITSWDFARIPR